MMGTELPPGRAHHGDSRCPATIPVNASVSVEIFDDEPWCPAAGRLHPENGVNLFAAAR
jgi:hypothetical protein